MIADIRAGSPVSFQFTVKNTAGTLVNADLLPAITLIVNGVDDGTVVTVVNQSVGIYQATLTPAAWNAGSSIQYRATAIIGGKTVSGVKELGQVARPLIDASFGWDVADTPGVPSSTLGRLRRFFGEYFFPRSRDQSTGTETSFAANGTTALHQRQVATADGVDTITTVAPVAP